MSAPARAACAGCGQQSATDDHCDGCGAGPEPAAAPSTATSCPACGSAPTADDSFCETCGLDLLSGELPMPPPAPVAAPTGPAQEARTGWSALVGADRDFFQSHGADVTAGLAFPEGLQPREVALCGPEVVVGRRNAARGYFPDIDLSSPVNDPAVSRRHVILRQQPDGTWELVDQHPVNGTWVNGAAAPLPAGSVIPLHDGDRVHLGAFSVLQVRRNGRAAS